eukprot:GGOE01050040.1.p1 GENE.GGOE01050040.1~~GGOE01050040.1.p1  ORF type:complete len:427 (-),score=164.27 GGOE01050040.1:332-1456(-)
MIDHNIYGIDINKTTPEVRARIRKQISAPDPDRKELHLLDKVEPALQRFVIPESAGTMLGVLYIFHLWATLVLCPTSARPDLHISIPTACLVILLALFLGWADDVLEVRWREKVAYSLISTIPMLLVYNGPTVIVIPKPLQFLAVLGVQVFGTHLDLGPLYLCYMGLWCVFCTNSINILAGINGLEVGQALVIAVACLVHNLIQYHKATDEESALAPTLALLFLLPFIAVCCALWQYNRCPARWFIGDSFTYFAGTVLACTAMVGHFTKTSMLFFLPQLINFVLSLPQLMPQRLAPMVPFCKPCPRHRVPTFNPDTGLLENSGNYTLLNAYLWLFGPCTEEQLCRSLLCFQVLCCAVGFYVRYYLAALFYDLVQ